jgi:hypothetical protein
MTPNQKSILVKLVLGNLVLYAVLAFFVFGPPLPSFPDLIALLPTRAPTATPTPRKPTATVTSVPSPTPTLAPKPTTRIVRAPVATPVPQIPVAAATGANPQNPILPADEWRMLGANSQVWYKIGDGGVHMDVALQSKPLDGVTFEVYAPNQLGQPVGQGTYQNRTGSLVWAGGFWQAAGSWLARIVNSNPMSVQYKMTSAVKDISNKSCNSYWEYIGDKYVYWTKCE